MGFFKRKRRNEKFETNEHGARVIPTSDLKNFKPPLVENVEKKDIANSDVTALNSLKSQLSKFGVIDDTVKPDTWFNFEDQGLDEINRIVEQANANAKTEKDFTPETYDENTIKSLEENDSSGEIGGWDNPLLDGFDVSENTMYDDGRNKKSI